MHQPEHPHREPGLAEAAHFPPQPARSAEPRVRRPRRRRSSSPWVRERLWLVETAAAGCSRMRIKIAEVVDLAALHDAKSVDRALGQGATAGRFGHDDLAAFLTHGAGGADAAPDATAQRAGEHNSLAQGTAGWAGLGERG